MRGVLFSAWLEMNQVGDHRDTKLCAIEFCVLLKGRVSASI